ncbi:MAG: hypothetical protein R6U66_10125, partial [Bacteroidales bacterium]
IILINASNSSPKPIAAPRSDRRFISFAFILLILMSGFADENTKVSQIEIAIIRIIGKDAGFKSLRCLVRMSSVG